MAIRLSREALTAASHQRSPLRALPILLRATLHSSGRQMVTMAAPQLQLHALIPVRDHNPPVAIERWHVGQFMESMFEQREILLVNFFTDILADPIDKFDALMRFLRSEKVDPRTKEHCLKKLISYLENTPNHS